MKNKKRELSETEEMLLVKYIDGECGVVGRYRSRRLIATNEEAKEFVDSLNSVSEQIKQLGEKRVDSVKLDIWDRVERRIDAEERIEFYHGQRQLELEKTNKRSFWPQVAWGLSGSLVTACAATVIFYRAANSGPAQTGDEFASRFQKSLEALDAQTGPDGLARNVSLPLTPRRDLGRSSSRPIEVDWMRSDGRVHMIQNPDERSAIIWVKRKNRSFVAVDEDATQSLSPESIATKSALDRPILFRERIPDSVSVSSEK